MPLDQGEQCVNRAETQEMVSEDYDDPLMPLSLTTKGKSETFSLEA